MNMRSYIKRCRYCNVHI